MDPLINIDWFSYNCSLSQEQIDPSFTFNSSKYFVEYQDIGTKIFNNRVFIYEDNVKIATLLYAPRSRVIKENLLQVHIANKILYTRKLSDFINEINQEFDLFFINMSRLDICIDSSCFISGSVDKFISDFASNKIIRLSKSSGYLPFKGGRDNKFTGISWVSKGSSVSWKIYNKSLEMREMDNHKKYIRDVWSLNGWDGIEDIFRLEVSLSKFSKINLVDKKTGLYVTNNFETILSNIDNLLSHYLHSTFKFCYNENKSNVSRNTKYVFHDMKMIRYKSINKISNYQDPTRKSKIVASDLFNTILKTSSNELRETINIYDTLLYYIKNYQLEEYFINKFNVDMEIIMNEKNELIDLFHMKQNKKKEPVLTYTDLL